MTKETIRFAFMGILLLFLAACSVHAWLAGSAFAAFELAGELLLAISAFWIAISSADASASRAPQSQSKRFQ